MRTRPQVLTLVVLTFLAAVARGEKLHFLSKTAVDTVKWLPAPPARDSEEAKAELDLVVALQAKRTTAQEKRCCAEDKLGMAAYQSVFGEWFTVEKLPKVDTLLKKAGKDAGYFLETAKTHFERPRPFVVDDRVRPIVEKEKTCAYPSGHATRGILFARILAKIAPDSRAELMERGREIGWDRVIAGVHRPSDIAAGRIVGVAVANAMFDSKEFQQELAAAKAEFEEVRRKQRDWTPTLRAGIMVGCDE